MVYTEEEFIIIFDEIIEMVYLSDSENSLDEIRENEKKKLDWKNKRGSIYKKYLIGEKETVNWFCKEIPMITEDLDYQLLDFQGISKESKNVKKEIYNLVFAGSSLNCQLKTFQEVCDYFRFHNKFSKKQEDVKEDIKIRMIDIFGEEVLEEVGFDINKI